MYLKLSKFFFLLLVMYYGWFQEVFFQIPNMLLFLGAIMMACIILHACINKINILKYITIELSFWLLFAFTSFAFGFFIARNRSIMTSYIVTYVEFLILIYGMIYISDQEKSINFFVKSFVFFSTVCSITTIFFGVEYISGRISMGVNNNPNSVGIIMAIGVCCVLYNLNMKRLFQSIFSFAIIFLLLYAAILTGSRKSFLSIVLVFVYWILFVVFKEIKIAKLKGIALLLLLVVIGVNIVTIFFRDSILLFRLSDLFESGSNIRSGMYRAAFKLFEQSPIIGIGFNNYRILSGYGTYSHSTYAEALACTGLIGITLYFSPYIIIFKKYYTLFINRNLSGTLHRETRVMLGLFFMLLFLGIGIIHFYTMSSNIAFGMIIALSNIYNKEYLSENNKNL